MTPQIHSVNRAARQNGAAALFVTLILVAIATIATMYANRSAYLFQKSSVNQYQYNMALGAAEAGMNAFIAQLEADLQQIETSTTPATTLIQSSSGGSSSSCAPGSASSSFAFKNSYAATNDQVFDSDKYYTGLYSLVGTAISGVNPGLGYRVQARFDGGVLSVISEGCAGNTETGNNICSGDVARAKVRRQLKVTGGFAIGDTAITVGNYADAWGAAHITANAGRPLPSCSVLYGDSYAYGGSQNYQCKTGACPPEKNTALSTNLFSSLFNGQTKQQIKQVAGSNVFTGCPPATSYSNKVVWIEGDLSSSCAISGTDMVIVINGAIRGQLQTTGSSFVYTNNVYGTGSFDITGSIAIEDSWDVAPLGQIISGSANGKMDSNDPFKAPTHAFSGTQKITYEKVGPPDSLKKKINSDSKSWVDF
ncbi:pilus assembly PilX family protein [Chitinolyticbacter meiyuanensis]|uniref:pilus assembly PilX family protein n=1 Tax=Chitinolyticbacter meiyuanensis TaxID=682798 RepID=UPI0011E59B76|nr:pilus assembly PilX N-terminal domain-containing protein [Chitinolyticbacter meiyuanensis]